MAMRLEQLDRAWRCLDRIKPKKRIAFLLRVTEGLSLEEIAEQVGARPPAVAQRILHAQRELLALMQKGGRP
jgi:RNA polymerase sigma factor (sigma-70 family)